MAENEEFVTVPKDSHVARTSTISPMPLNMASADRGRIVFMVGGDNPFEAIAISGDGKIYVRGREVETDQGVVEGLRYWLNARPPTLEEDLRRILKAAPQETVVQAAERVMAGHEAR